VDFAARKIEEAKVVHEVELMKLEKPFSALTPQAQAEVLRTRVYFYFACKQMEACI
jgi:ABC-type uncharacterized transport system ATPase subunit